MKKPIEIYNAILLFDLIENFGNIEAFQKIFCTYQSDEEGKWKYHQYLDTIDIYNISPEIKQYLINNDVSVIINDYFY